MNEVWCWRPRDPGRPPHIGANLEWRRTVFVAQALLPAASTLVSRPILASRGVSTRQTESPRHGFGPTISAKFALIGGPPRMTVKGLPI